MQCVQFIGIAKEALKRSTLNGCWKAIWPTCIAKNEEVPDMDATIIKISKAVGKEGFENLEKKDLEELMIDYPLDDDELMELLVESEAVSSRVDDNAEYVQEFNQTKLIELLALAEKLGDLALDEDLVTERAVQFRADLQKAMTRYNELLKHQSRSVSSDNSSVHDVEMLSP